MAYTSSAVAPHHFSYTDAAAPAKRGLFSRLIDTLMEARARQVDREVARYLIENTGGKFTDQAEREIERRFLSNTTRW